MTDQAPKTKVSEAKAASHDPSKTLAGKDTIYFCPASDSPEPSKLIDSEPLTRASLVEIARKKGLDISPDGNQIFWR